MGWIDDVSDKIGVIPITSLQCFVCGDCDERWLGHFRDPATKDWLMAHSEDHQVIPVTGPRGFGGKIVVSV